MSCDYNYDPCARDPCTPRYIPQWDGCGWCPRPAPTPLPIPSRLAITYIADIIGTVLVPAGGVPIPPGTIIPLGQTTVPAGTVTVLTGYGAPSSSIGGFIVNNGFFTAPCAGFYSVSVNAAFAIPPAVAATDVRELYLYRVSVSGLVMLLGVDSKVPSAATLTYLNVSTSVELFAGDRIFAAVRQDSAAALGTAPTGRIAIVKI